jgi:predicted DNA-binding transcriptional regulator AlpA
VTDATAQALLQRFDQLERLLVTTLNRRLSREDMCERLGVGRSTLTRRIAAKKVPRPGADGKWLLSDVVQWETGRCG